MNFLEKDTGLLIRFDDVAENMNWDLMDKCEELFSKYNIKPVVGVIPNNKDKDLLSFPYRKDFWNKVRIWQSKKWVIAIHGYNHLYDNVTNKKDFFKHGGNSEFYGHSLDSQIDKLKKSIEIFKDNKIKVRCFFAPNHTYDKNTFQALKTVGIKEVIDGYGLIPYEYEDIKFIPQLFYRPILLPFGIQSTQIHLNTWTLNDFKNFENFIIKNSKKIINYEYAISRINSNMIYKIINYLTKYILIIKRNYSKF
tara:strand:+ start:96 stop:851 length:756 start_codon:yes stop_codon:yes gene_type:complete